MAGRAHLVGITGPPGLGQVDARRGADRRGPRGRPDRSAVIAVDPSSPITGGALLGDRVRMQSYADDRDVFIRSMAVARARRRAGLDVDRRGGRARRRRASTSSCIETVGTGQSEVEVAAAADTTVVLEAPEMGDEVQAIKAGLLEVADLVVVNKGDKPGAQRTAAQLRAMLVPPTGAARAPAEGRRPRRAPKRPEVLVTTATTGEGVPELLAALDRHRARRARRGRPSAARLARAEAQVWAIVGERLRDRLRDAAHAAAHRRGASRRSRPTGSTRIAAADRLLDELAWPRRRR